jgi:Uma2 family endonuclease
MHTEPTSPEIHPLILHIQPLLRKVNEHDFFEFCQQNQDLHIERTSEGDLVIMPPTGGETGKMNFDLNVEFGIWAKADGQGFGFDSSTGFTLPNGAKRSPDLAWVKRERWDGLTKAERQEFPPLCPDFVVEIRSRTDSINTLKEKMEEYLANGAQLGWLIDPLEKRVYIYRPSVEVHCLENPETVSGAPMLPGFFLKLQQLWN